MQHYVLNKVKKPGLREDAPQQKLSLFQIRAADATYIAQKQLAEATKQVTITNSRTKNLQDTATRHQRNAAALIPVLAGGPTNKTRPLNCDWKDKTSEPASI